MGKALFCCVFSLQFFCIRSLTSFYILTNIWVNLILSYLLPSYRWVKLFGTSFFSGLQEKPSLRGFMPESLMACIWAGRNSLSFVLLSFFPF